MKYRYLLFDADATLLDFDTAEHQAITETLEAFDLPVSEEVIDLYSRINAALWLKFDHGEIERAPLLVLRFSQLMDALNRDNSRAAEMSLFYLHALARADHLLPGALELCRDLAQMGYELAIITNGVSIPQHGRLDNSPMRPYFRKIFISDDMGCQKPQPEYFDQVCAGLGISAEDRKYALVIGDSLSSDMQGGLNAGIDTCWYNPKGKALNPNIPVTYDVRSFEEIMELLSAED